MIAIENVRLFQELKESLEQQTATSEIWASSPARRPTSARARHWWPKRRAFVGSGRACSWRQLPSHPLGLLPGHGSLPIAKKLDPRGTLGGRGTILGRAVIDRQTIHIHDLAAGPKLESLNTDRRLKGGCSHRASYATAPRRQSRLGLIHIRRKEVRPFSEKRMALLKTSADQAVIAIENVRLFQELEARTRELVQWVGELKALGEVGQAVSSTLVSPRLCLAPIVWTCGAALSEPVAALSPVSTKPVPRVSPQGEFPTVGGRDGLRTLQVDNRYR